MHASRPSDSTANETYQMLAGAFSSLAFAHHGSYGASLASGSRSIGHGLNKTFILAYDLRPSGACQERT
jgi:hypothetical protein